MQPTCPRGSVQLSRYANCGLPCLTGQIESTRDDLYCVVSQVCPSGMTLDGADNALCLKPIPIAKNGFGCATGFTEWRTGLCFLDCPVGFRELGESCVISTVSRKTLQPTCIFLFELTGDVCNPSIYAVLLFIAIVVYFGTSHWSPKKRCT